MSRVALEANLLPASDQLLNNQSWRGGMDTWLEFEQLSQAFFQETEKQIRVLVPEWNSPYTVVFQARRTGKTWSRKTIELHSRLVAAYQSVELAQPIDRGEADSKLFSSLVSEWHEERRNASWTVDIAMCLSYQKIIAMGKERAVPLILEQLEAEGDEPDHWFWALRILTDINPVPEEHQGDIVGMAKDWIAWGKKSGYAA